MFNSDSRSDSVGIQHKSLKNEYQYNTIYSIRSSTENDEGESNQRNRTYVFTSNRETLHMKANYFSEIYIVRSNAERFEVNANLQ